MTTRPSVTSWQNTLGRMTRRPTTMTGRHLPQTSRRGKTSGSGMTGVAAQMCANPPADLLEQFPELKERIGPRHVILNDLSPAACHIAYNYNTPVDVDALRREFERIKAAVKDEFNWLYGTEHYEPAVGDYDPANADVASRLKNPPGIDSMHTLLGGEECTWELLTKAEVEARLGYPVTDLPRGKEWGNLDVVQVKQWVCIPATIQYTIWSDVYRCEGFVTIEEPTGKVSTRGKNAGKPMVQKKRVGRGCGVNFALWDAARNHDTGEVADSFPCPHCKTVWTKLQLTRVDAVPVITNYLVFRLQAFKDGIREARFRGDRRTTERERLRSAEIEQAQSPYWIPEVKMDANGPQYRRSALNVRGIKKVVDFWTPRNRRAFAALWHHASGIAEPRLNCAVKFLLTSFVARVSRKSEFRESGGAGNTHNLTISSITREDNLLKAWAAKEKDIVGFYSHAERVFRSDNARIRVGSATALPEIPDCSVDYTFTDPPFVPTFITLSQTCCGKSGLARQRIRSAKRLSTGRTMAARKGYRTTLASCGKLSRRSSVFSNRAGGLRWSSTTRMEQYSRPSNRVSAMRASRLRTCCCSTRSKRSSSKSKAQKGSRT